MKRFTILIFCVLVTPIFLFSQYTFKGKVVDEIGETLIGASILIKGMTSGTITGIDGLFTISSKDSTITLLVNYTGYSGQELTVSHQYPILITMYEGVMLNEVVVTGLVISKEKKAMGIVLQQLVAKMQKEKEKSSIRKMKLKSEVILHQL